MVANVTLPAEPLYGQGLRVVIVVCLCVFSPASFAGFANENACPDGCPHRAVRGNLLGVQALKPRRALSVPIDAALPCGILLSPEPAIALGLGGLPGPTAR